MDQHAIMGLPQGLISLNDASLQLMCHDSPTGYNLVLETPQGAEIGVNRFEEK
jgi:hypothetical protein